jgi:hypothetical protein
MSVASYGVFDALALLASAKGYRRTLPMLTYCSCTTLLLVTFIAFVSPALGQAALAKDGRRQRQHEPMWTNCRYC